MALVSLRVRYLGVYTDPAFAELIVVGDAEGCPENTVLRTASRQHKTGDVLRPTLQMSREALVYDVELDRTKPADEAYMLSRGIRAEIVTSLQWSIVSIRQVGKMGWLAAHEANVRARADDDHLNVELWKRTPLSALDEPRDKQHKRVFYEM